ncbi:hypothetical protein EXIGUO8A_80433 [Exiguobacterium sp. 8A]|nr:hypothetical protein EXIGUO8A_80433 [Exiguobacterium sp. 8A]
MRFDAFADALGYEVFQSTHLHEVRFNKLLNGVTGKYCNPRTYTRCDSTNY